MAFGKKYFSEYKSGNNLEYYCEIWVEGQTAAAVQIEIGEGGPIIEYDTDKNDRFSPIISSSCKFPFLVKNFLFADFIDELRTIYQEREVYLHLYRSPQSGHLLVAPLWSGYLVMDLGSGVDQSFPYDQELVFTDGLSLLKDVDWVNLGLSGGTPPFEERTAGNYAEENMYYGPGRFTYWLKEVLKKTGAATTFEGASQNYRFTTAVNWYNGINNVITQSSDPLYLTKSSMSLFHTKDDNGVFYPDNTYNVLKQILRHWGARITYWKHQFWIVQIPEYIENSSGTITAPININSRVYSNTGSFQGSQPHLGSTYYSRYDQTISNQKISKLTGTQYSYLPRIKNVKADFLSFSSKNYYGGFPFGLTATTQELFQGTINNPSTADFIWLTIPLDWIWDMTGSLLVNGHTNGWWAYIKFNFYVAQEDDATGIITTYYLQYNSSSGSYYWIDSDSWVPLGNESPKYIIKSKNISESNYIGFQQKIPFIDDSGNAISMSGAWSFYLDIEDYSSNGSFYCNFSGYGSPQIVRNPQQARNLPSPSGIGNTTSGKVLWANTLQDAQGVANVNIANPNPSGFNAGTGTDDFELNTTSPFMGLLQLLNNTTSASFGQSFDTLVDSNNKDSEEYSFGQLLWGDAVEFSQSALEVYNGTTYQTTDPVGQWGRGILSGNKTFTELLVDEFLTGQTKIVISPSMRLAVGNENKTETIGLNSRPRYVNPIGKLRETRDGVDPEYFFRKGSFYTLLDEWDYEGYQIIRNALSSTTTTNNIGNLGGSQFAQPYSNSMVQNPTTQALMMNSPVAYIRQTVASTGTNVAVNGNFNTAVGWTLGTGWSIDTTAKKAKFTATGLVSDLSQSVLTEELTYQINFRVVVTAGTLLVKAGSSGTTETITASGDYSIYLDCEGSNIIKFQAGTTFTGNITYITIADQKSLSSLPINVIGNAVFKTGDTFNLINSNSSEIMPLIVTSNQGANDDSVSVSSTPLFEDIDPGSFLLINQDDLSEQYQNKTKGTVAGYGITATGIAKSGINITGWLNSDTMTGATVTNVPTALSVKNYVDGQAGHDETLQQVTDNGNTTTNSIMIGSSSSPSEKLEVVGNIVTTQNITLGNNNDVKFKNSVGNAVGVLRLNSSNELVLFNGNSSNGHILFVAGNVERMRSTPTGLGIGTTSPSGLLHISDSSTSKELLRVGASANGYWKFQNAGSTTSRVSLTAYDSSGNPKIYLNPTTDSYFNGGNFGINIVSPTEKLHVVGKGIFTDQLTIPATPVATTDAASKSYVDAHGGGLGPFLPLAGGTLTGSLTGTTATFSGDVSIDSGSNSQSLIVDSTNNTLIRFRINGASAGFIQTTLLDFIMYNAHSGSFRWLENGGTERMRLTDSGNVGIGTTSPSAKLDVAGTGAGTIFTVGRDSRANGYFDLNFNGQLSNFDSLTGYTFNRQGAEKMRISNIGNVGIGTSSPTKKLEVSGDVKIDSLSTVAQLFIDSVATSDVVINFTNNDIQKSKIGWDYSADAFAIVTGTGSFSTADMVITSAGNVGIGTTSPTEKLHVVGKGIFTDQLTIPATPVSTTDAASKSYVDAHGGGLGPFLPLTGGTLSGSLTGTTATFSGDLLVGSGEFISWGTAGQTAIEGSTASNKLNFLISGSSKMWLNSTGLGIGTTSPVRKLDVNSDVSSDIARFGNNNGNFTFGQTSLLTSIDLATSNKFRIRQGSTTPFYINATGNVGIGTTSPESFNAGANKLVVGDGTNYQGITINSVVEGNIYFADGTASSQTYEGVIGYNHSNNFMHFFTNHTEKARITSGGNLLLGTTTDSGQKLVISDSIPTLRISGTRNANWTVNQIMASLEYFSDDASGSAANSVRASINLVNEVSVYGSTTGLSFSTKGDVAGLPTEKMRISSAGNIGIGTTSPSTKFDLIGGGPSSTFRLSNSSSDNTVKYGSIIGRHYKNSEEDVAGMLITSSSNAFAQSVIIGGGISGVNAVNIVAFYTGADYTTLGGTERMRINNSGNVLIGTSTDSGEKLVVAGTAKFGGQVTIPATPVSTTDAASKSYVDAHGGGLGPFLPLTGGTLTASDENVLKLVNNAGQPSLIRFNDTSTTNDPYIGSYANDLAFGNYGVGEKMRLTSTGLGIGTTSPAYKLDVRNTGNLFYGQTDLTNTTSIFRIRANGGTNEVLEIQANGNVGIGTASPKGKAHILDGTAANYTPNSEADTLVIESATPGGISIIGTGGSGLEKQKIIFGTTSNVDMAVIDYDPNNSFMRIGTTTTSNYLKFTSGNGVEGMRLTASSNILIGTTTDSGGKLRIEYAGGSPNGMVVQSTSNRSKIAIADNNTIAYVVAEDSFASYGMNDSLSANNLNINSSGNVGIGIATTPSAKLEVNGSIKSSSIGIATTPSAVYKLDVNGKARVQSVLELDDVLTLNAISTPADPASGKSSIWMDTSGDIKVKINVSGTIVTRTIAAFE